jgi:hypothetical protein
MSTDLTKSVKAYPQPPVPERRITAQKGERTVILVEGKPIVVVYWSEKLNCWVKG